MYNYAQLDNDGYCIGISELSDTVVVGNLIPLEVYDLAYIRRKYDTVSKQWTNEYKSLEVPVSRLSLRDVKADTTNIDTTTMLTSDDALTIMEIQLSNEDKLNRILTHLGLQ